MLGKYAHSSVLVQCLVYAQQDLSLEPERSQTELNVDTASGLPNPHVSWFGLAALRRETGNQTDIGLSLNAGPRFSSINGHCLVALSLSYFIRQSSDSHRCPL